MAEAEPREGETAREMYRKIDREIGKVREGERKRDSVCVCERERERERERDRESERESEKGEREKGRQAGRQRGRDRDRDSERIAKAGNEVRA